MSKKNRATDRAGRAAAAIEEQQRQERRRRTLMIGGVVAVLLAVVAVIVVITVALDPSKDVSAPAAGSEFGLTIGPEDAPHEVIIYEDFLCPFCGELEHATSDELAALAADGKVRVEYRPINLLSSRGDYSSRSAGAFSIVLQESGADVAKQFHDLLFENQPSESGPFPTDDDLIDLAVEAGADEADIRDRIENQDGQAWVDKATEAAFDSGVQGTPTILLDGEVFPNGRTMEDTAQNLLDELQ